MFPKCEFSREFLHPRYWFTRLGPGVLWLWVQLPHPVLCFLGIHIGIMARPFLKRHESIARKNLELYFPQYSAKEREKMIAKSFRSLGIALAETGMTWFWSDSHVRRWLDVERLDNLKHAQIQNCGVMVVGVHFTSLELGSQVMGLCQPMMVTYRLHSNQLTERAQTRGRIHSNKAVIGGNNLRGTVSALGKGEAVWFAPDQGYGRKDSSLMSFFMVENVATINGTYILSCLSGAAMLTITMVGRADHSGYRLHIILEMGGYPTDENQAAAYMNKIIEKEIMCVPEQHLQIHRRFETYPVGESSLYI